MELTLELMVDLAGPIEDGSSASEQFREVLLKEASIDDLRSLMNEALEGSEPYHNRALQDIVNNIGERIGFDVEYGRYQGNQTEIGYDGLWETNTLYTEDTYIVVETKKTAAYAIDPEYQPGQYMSEVIDERGINEDQVYGLIVVGKTDLMNVVQTIRGSSYRDQIRVVSSSRLFELLKMLETTSLQPGQAAEILLPMDAVDIGSLVELITDVVQSSSSQATLEDGLSKEYSKKKVDMDKIDIWENIEKETGIEHDNGDVNFNEDQNGVENYISAINSLIKKGYLTENDLPCEVSPKSGRYIINSEPAHKDGSDMYQEKEVENNWYIETNNGTKDKKQYLKRLVNNFAKSKTD